MSTVGVSSGASPGSTSGGLPFVTGVRRQLDYYATVYARTWKASAISSFVAPLFYVVAMGVLLGGFIQGDPAKLEGATSYLQFIVPGLVAAHAMQTAIGETTYPVMANFKWNKVYDSMRATPLTPAHIAAAHLCFVAFRVATACGVFMIVLAPFGVFGSWWGPLVAYLAQILVGVTFATLMYGLTCRLKSESTFGVILRLGVFPMFLFSGAFFPVSNLGPVGAAVARLTPLWHGVSLSRMFCIDHVDWSTAAVNTGVLLALTGFGCWWSVSGLTKRLQT